MFYSISTADKIATIADAIIMREHEIFGYDTNITNYTVMLAALPQDDWPVNLAQYQYVTLDQVPDEHDDIVNQYQFRDRLRHLLKTERAERAKSYSVYQALIAQIPVAELDAVIAAAIARKNAAQTP
jgi:hypothetical protein